MAKAFSIARGVSTEDGKIVEGHYDPRFETITTNDGGKTVVCVDPSTLEVSTGFVDKGGKEIFTGDLVYKTEKDGKKTFWRVGYDDDQGAFYLRLAIGVSFTRKDALTVRIWEDEKK